MAKTSTRSHDTFMYLILIIRCDFLQRQTWWNKNKMPRLHLVNCGFRTFDFVSFYGLSLLEYTSECGIFSDSIFTFNRNIQSATKYLNLSEHSMT